jgi:phosphoglycerol transferase MdoB-like AlkP superfamily enzyme
MAHQALWTGNNSFTSFSAATLNLVLALLALAGGMYCARVRRRAAEVITMVSIALYIAGIAFITLSFFYSSRGAVSAAVPWYMTVLLAPVVALCCLGLARWRNWGRWIAVVTVLLWAYVAAATWVAKLVPLYGGFEDAHARPRQLLAWYLHNSGQRDSILASLCPAPLALMYVLFAAVLAALLIAAAAVLASLFRTPASGFAPHEIP